MVDLKRCVQHGVDTQIPTAQPLIATVPEITNGRRRIISPRFAAGITHVREETVRAANGQIHDEVELERQTHYISEKRAFTAHS